MNLERIKFQEKLEAIKSFLQNFKESSRKEDVEDAFINQLLDKEQREKFEQKQKQKEKLRASQQNLEKKPKVKKFEEIAKFIHDEELLFDCKTLLSEEEQKLQKQEPFKLSIPPFFFKESLLEATLKQIHTDRCTLHLMNKKDKFKDKLANQINCFKNLFPNLADYIVSPDCLERIFKRLVFDYVESKF